MSHIHLIHLYICSNKPARPPIYGEYIYASKDINTVTDTLKYNQLPTSPDENYFIFRLGVPDSYNLTVDVRTGLVTIPNSTAVTFIYDGAKSFKSGNLEEEANAIKSLHLNNTSFCGG